MSIIDELTNPYLHKIDEDGGIELLPKPPTSLMLRAARKISEQDLVIQGMQKALNNALNEFAFLQETCDTLTKQIDLLTKELTELKNVSTNDASNGVLPEIGEYPPESNPGDQV